MESLKPGDPGYVHPTHRNTIVDKRMKSRREKALAKEMKEKEKQYKTCQSVWNIDSTRYVNTDVSIKYVANNIYQLLTLNCSALYNSYITGRPMIRHIYKDTDCIIKLTITCVFL